jgi:hypothetical protein
VRDKLPGLRPVATAREDIDSGRVSRMIFNKARLSSLKTSAKDFIEVHKYPQGS